MLTLTLSTLGLPLEGVGLLLAIDPILDMGRTAVNVAGQTVIPAIVAKREGLLDLETFNSKHGSDPFAEDEPAETAVAEEEREIGRASCRERGVSMVCEDTCIER